MTGTVSRTATASPRGGVGRKPQAKLRPDEHEAHTRRRHKGEGAMKPEAQSHPDRVGVDATGGWSEGHAQYPGRAARLLARATHRRETGRDGQKSAEAIVAGRTPAKGRTRGAEPDRCVREVKETQERGLEGPSPSERQAAEPPRYRNRSVKHARHEAEQLPGTRLGVSSTKYCAARTCRGRTRGWCRTVAHRAWTG